MIDLSSVKKLSIPEGEVKKVISGDEVLWQGGYKNWLPFATDSDRVTVLNGVGYVDGKRISESAGGLSTHASFSATGFIPCKEGDVVRIKGTSPVNGSSSVFMTFDSSNTKVSSKVLSATTGSADWSTVTSGYAQDSYENGILTIILDSEKWGTGFDSFRFAAALFDGDEIVTVNEEITS